MLTAIAFGILSLIGIVDTVVSETGRQKVLDKVYKLENQINQVSGLKNKLIEAFNKKDYKLANDLLASSPFSGTYHTLLQERNRIQREAESKYQKLDDLENEISSSKASYDKHSTASGLVGGTLAHQEDAKSDYSSDIDSLVQGGISTISDQPDQEFRGITIKGR